MEFSTSTTYNNSEKATKEEGVLRLDENKMLGLWKQNLYFKDKIILSTEQIST